jgi:outer membrane lipoprotein-sorting protein
MKMKTLQNYFLLGVFIILPLIATDVSSQGSSEKGNKIVKAVDSHEEGYINLRSDVTMILEDKQGKTRQRFFKFYMLESEPFGDKRKFIFVRPRDIKGTAILIHSNVIEDDDQWIYLPAFKRVKRISSNNKSTPFMGSEFSYEDLSSQELEKYDNRYINSEEVDGRECDVVERVPTFPNSLYSKVVSFVDQEDNRFRKIIYYDKSGGKIKTQFLDDYKLYSDRYLLPNKLVMINHANGKKTTMLWKDIQLKTEIKNNHFTVSSLKRSR